jgi:polyhydroxybutyrate depolymerase
MHPARPRTAPLALALVAAATLLLGACAGSSSDGGGASDDASTSADETTTTTEPVVDAAPAGEVATGEPVASAGCGRTRVRSDVLVKTFLDDSDRWFLLTTPLAHDGTTPLPLVIDLHGLSEGADVHSRMTDLATDADEEGFIVAMPEGTGTPVRWQVGLDPADNPDLAFVAEMLDQLEGKLCIDTSRIYATGLSNGAFFSSALGCSLSDRIAAIAPVAGVLRPEGCDPSRPVPVLSFHGTADPILLFNGGVGGRLNEVLENGPGAETTEEALPPADLDGPGYPANIRAWAEANGCEPDPTDEVISDTATRQVFDCPADGATEFIVLDGGGHSWPGSEFSKSIENVVGPTDDLDANAEIWAFFQRFRLPD